MIDTEIIIPIDDLTHEVYRFYFREDKKVLLLNYYCKYRRETKRHGWESEGGFYSRLNYRESDLKASEVPMTEEVKKKAFDEFVSKITVQIDKE
jgi:hypothetical protein